MLNRFSDPDNKVRYYACESLYNIARSCEEKILKYFNVIFDELSKLSIDPDSNVRSACDILDGFLKEIVTEYKKPIDIESFIKMISKRTYVIHAECRRVRHVII